MRNTLRIIDATVHRPWAMPSGRWQYYQEWNNALFLHWKVPADVVRSIVPAGLDIDVIDGNTWVSVVAFAMQQIRPRNLPPLAVVSDFHEINLRAYVTKDGKPGVYFLNIEAQKAVSVFLSKAISGLPYEKADMKRTQQGNVMSYLSRNPAKGYYLDARYRISDGPYHKTPLDNWLTERYCLYMDRGAEVYRYEIHHKEWHVQQVELEHLKINYHKGPLLIKDASPDLVYFSEGVQVLAWGKQRV